MSYANLTIKGNLTNAPELRATQSGTQVASFTVAFDAGYGDKKKAVFVRCAMFGKRADALCRYATKGAQILVSGEPSLEEWTGRDGVAHTSLKLNVEQFDFCGGKRADNAQPRAAEGFDVATVYTPKESEGEEIPF